MCFNPQSAAFVRRRRRKRMASMRIASPREKGTARNRSPDASVPGGEPRLVPIVTCPSYVLLSPFFVNCSRKNDSMKIRRGQIGQVRMPPEFCPRRTFGHEGGTVFAGKLRRCRISGAVCAARRPARCLRRPACRSPGCPGYRRWPVRLAPNFAVRRGCRKNGGEIREFYRR